MKNESSTATNGLTGPLRKAGPKPGLEALRLEPGQGDGAGVSRALRELSATADRLHGREGQPRLAGGYVVTKGWYGNPDITRLTVVQAIDFYRVAA